MQFENSIYSIVDDKCVLPTKEDLYKLCGNSSSENEDILKYLPKDMPNFYSKQVVSRCKKSKKRAFRRKLKLFEEEEQKRMAREKSSLQPEVGYFPPPPKDGFVHNYFLFSPDSNLEPIIQKCDPNKRYDIKREIDDEDDLKSFFDFTEIRTRCAFALEEGEVYKPFLEKGKKAKKETKIKIK